MGHSSSVARGVNADGSVVVGQGTSASGTEAFRWTQAGGMVGLGDLPGGSFFSLANAVNADGSVVVGAGTEAAGTVAIRWTQAGGMVSLGDLPGGSINGVANAVNADGSVVVGVSSSTIGFEAFRWTQSTGMVGLGTLGGGNSSFARSVDTDGAVVVGNGNGTGFPSHAFRWTAPTGMRDLNTLLANAGVNMTGIVLTNADGVSSNGQFIVGLGTFSSASRGYIVRYFDQETAPAPTPPTPTPVIAGLTTFSSVQSSIDNLSDARLGVMAQQHGLAAPLLGGDKPMGSGNEAGAFASAGSASGGGFLRYSFGTGFSLLGGLAYAKESYPDADLRHSGIGALALQYMYSGSGWWHPFVEAGGWIAPDAARSFSRMYMNGAGTATGTGDTHGDLSYYYARAGILLANSKLDQLALAAEYGRERMSVNAYAEPLSAANPFEAHVAAGTDSINLAKLRLAWLHRFTSRLDGTVWVAGVRGFNRESRTHCLCARHRHPDACRARCSTWAEYGARIGYKLTDKVTLDAFTNGVAGGDGIDARLHVGAGLRVHF